MAIRADTAERDKRFNRVREAMQEGGLAALIVAGHGSGFNRGSIRYFADAHMWEGDGLLLIPLDGEAVHAHVTYAGVSVPQEPWIPDFRRSPEPQTQIIKARKEKGLTRRKIGIAGRKRVITVGAIEALKEALPNVEFVSADLLVSRIRAVKSELELAQMRGHWKMSQSAMDRFVEVVGPGVTEREAAAGGGQSFQGSGFLHRFDSDPGGELQGLAEGHAVEMLLPGGLSPGDLWRERGTGRSSPWCAPIRSQLNSSRS